MAWSIWNAALWAKRYRGFVPGWARRRPDPGRDRILTCCCCFVTPAPGPQAPAHRSCHLMRLDFRIGHQARCGNARRETTEKGNLMQKLALLAAVAALPLAAPSALAQQPGDYNWNGSYIGANLGQGDNADFELDAALEVDPGTAFFPGALAGGTFPTMRTFDGDGLVGGIQAGHKLAVGHVCLRRRAGRPAI